MKRGFTLTELLVVVSVLGILAAIAMPSFRNVLIRNNFREVEGMANTTASAAQYYDLKYGIASLDTMIFNDPTDQDALWDAISLTNPGNPASPKKYDLRYSIANATHIAGSGAGLRVESYDGSIWKWLYEYRFPSPALSRLEGRAINTAGNDHSKYIANLDLP